MSSNFPWYQLVTDESLKQGDFLFSCGVLEPTHIPPGNPGEKARLKGIVKDYDVVILSHSCDLVQGKLETILVCPHWTIDEFVKFEPKFNDPGYKENIRKGNVVGYHMLAACELPNFVSPIRIVSFRQVFGLPFAYTQSLMIHQNPRLSLLPPYREHLAQAFARFIMRIGLPVDIPSFKNKSEAK
jgi:hypothetical protein